MAGSAAPCEPWPGRKRNEQHTLRPHTVMSPARYRATIRRTRFISVAMIFVVFPHSARAWGRNGNKLVVNKAIDTLPADIRAFFESNRALLSQHVTDPRDTIATKAAERHNH